MCWLLLEEDELIDLSILDYWQWWIFHTCSGWEQIHKNTIGHLCNRARSWWRLEELGTYIYPCNRPPSDPSKVVYKQVLLTCREHGTYFTRDMKFNSKFWPNVAAYFYIPHIQTDALLRQGLFSRLEKLPNLYFQVIY